MAMSVGGGEGKTVPYINMTPLIDVLLVLLIIFMVITPITPKGLEALVPQPNEDQQNQQQQPNARTVVVSVNANRSIMINRDTTSLARLEESLRDIFKTRAERVMFVRGAPALDYQDVARVIDIGKGAGVDKIGLLTEEIE
ncbi:MAG: biopolymer transporter ExbD [Bryobacterales bacterium]|nr:biopolymer transporter ExbD [Bryobacterales bacterium]MDE0627045.1 biopolymer transporter ExbD [Bryobacterales bacterium]